jgi:response regulator RpfG family c-di-GMP phosphodiesterase
MVKNKASVERTVLLYVIFASLWVFLAEQVPALLSGSNSAVLSFLHVYRGTGFVVFSGILIYILLLMGSPTEVAKLTEKFPGRQKSAEGVKPAHIELSNDLDALIERWAQALEMRNQESAVHCWRISEMTVQLGKSFGLTDEELVHIRRGAHLHDIGKMALPDSILMKNGPLTEDERAVMQQHPDIAFQLLSGISALVPALDIPYCHHEKWDGSGYPRGLKGSEIPLSARIFTVIDVWDALTSERPFRNSLPERAALTYIRSQSGSHFDPSVVEKFLELSRIKELRYREEESEALGVMN